MEVTNIIDILLIVACVIMAAAQTYFRIRGNVAAAVTELIAFVEKQKASGAEKMDTVVKHLSESVPAPFNKVLTEKVLRSMAQAAFDWMKDYAKAYAAAAEEAESPEDRKEKTGQKLDALNKEALSQTVTGLFDLSVETLKVTAAAYGAEVPDGSTRDDYIKAIVKALLNK